MATHMTSLRRSSRIISTKASSSVLKDATAPSTRLSKPKLVRVSRSPSNSDAEPSSSRRPTKRVKKSTVKEEQIKVEVTSAHLASNVNTQVENEDLGGVIPTLLSRVVDAAHAHSRTTSKAKNGALKRAQSSKTATSTDVEPVKKTSKTKGKAKAMADDPVPEDFPPRGLSPWRVGPHVSAAGGVENAVLNAASLGATAFALFLKSQRKWSSPPLTDDSVASFKRRLRDFGYEPKHVMPHGNYLVNLGNPDAEKREKSYECFLDDLKRCEQLGLSLYNFHPGSTVGQAEPHESLSLIAQCLNRAHKETSSVITVIENMAGSGNVLGSKFKELGKIIGEVEDKSRVGVCLDTCHMFAAGYDVRTQEGWDKTMDEFERDVGLKYLRGMHLNDSKVTLGSHKDRHENIGQGHLGLKAFMHILTDPRTQDIPLIMETPAHYENGSTKKGKGKKKCFGDGWEVWKKEIDVLKRLSSAEAGDSEKNINVWTAEIRDVVESIGGEVKEAETKTAKRAKANSAKRKRDQNEGEDEEYHSCCSHV